MRQLHYGLLSTLIILSACSKNTQGPAVPGPISASRAQVDFGLTSIGRVKRLDVILLNGGGTATVQNIQVGASVFHVDGAPKSLPPGPTTMHLVFAPAEEGVVESTLTLTTENQTLQIALTGKGANSCIEITPEVLDFGPVEVGARARRNITITNDCDVTDTVKILSDTRMGMFQFSLPDATTKKFSLAPGSSFDRPVTFEPMGVEPAGFIGTIDFQPCETCTTLTVALKGVGIDSLVSVDPPDCLDFGLVNPGSSITRPVTIGNRGSAAFSILEASVSTSSDVFTLEPATLLPIDPAGKLELNVTYHPTKAEQRTGSLQLTTNDPGAPTVNVCLRGAGGGPDVSVTPTALDFGDTAVGLSRFLVVHISNRGVSTPGADPSLTTLQIIGARIVIPATSSTSPNEFSANWRLPINLSLSQGTLPPVTYAPEDAGDDLAILELTTNDADSPIVQITLTGKGLVLAPCQLNILPASGTLDFGLVNPNRTTKLSFVVENAGTEACLFDPPTLGAGSNAAISLPGRAPSPVMFAAGARQVIDVEIAPKGATGTITGTIELTVNDPNNPHRVLVVKGSSGQGCLLVAPDAEDFNTVGVGCATSSRTVTVYNQCTTAVQLKSLSLAGTASSAFRLGTASLPLSLLGGASTQFDVQYAPTSAQADLGGVLVQTDERPEPYLVPLIGNAVTGSAVHEDTWSAATPSKVDVLFVIDTGVGIKGGLLSYLDAFVDAATQAGIDFHIAVTTNGTANGAFAQAAGNPAFVTPQTPNAGQVLIQNGISSPYGPVDDQIFETAALALEPARLASTYAGFIRNDANLLLIFENDEPDQSARSYAYYSALFRSIHGFRAPMQLMVSGIISTDPMSFDYGANYAQMANETGGTLEQYYAANWVVSLQNIAARAFGRRFRYPVTGTPANPQDITVLIDGQQVAQTQGAAVNWSYSPSTSTIVFDTLTAPVTGSTVQIRYPAECLAP